MSDNSHSNPADCDTIRELVPEYAFGLTDSEETRLVKANLARCPEARDQLADYRLLQAELRAAVPQIEPPTALGDRLMAAIAPPVVRAQPQRRRPVQWTWMAAGLAVILLLSSNLYWLARVNDLQRQQYELASRIASQPSTAFVVSDTSGLHWVRLPPSQQNANTSAFMMWNSDSETGLLYARGFPQLEVGKTYQLWLTTANEKVSVGTFHVNTEGDAALVFHCTQPIDKYSWARITAEPGNGSATPSEQIVVNGKLST